MTDQQTTPAPGAVSPEGSTAPDTEPGASRATAIKAPGKGPRDWLRSKPLILLLTAVLLVIITMVGTGGGKTLFGFKASLLGSKVSSPLKVAPATAVLGQSVRDGRFAFLVTSVQRPSKTLTGRTGARETAEGAFVIVRVDVTNIGYEPLTLTATDQFLVSDKGKRFATSAAISSLKGAEQVFLEKINPGHTVSAAPLLFDVPAGTTMASIELHESLSSTGVKVRLS